MEITNAELHIALKLPFTFDRIQNLDSIQPDFRENMCIPSSKIIFLVTELRARGIP